MDLLLLRVREMIKTMSFRIYYLKNVNMSTSVTLDKAILIMHFPYIYLKLTITSMSMQLQC